MTEVLVSSVEIDGKIGYDVEVLSPTATIQSYLDSLNQFIENTAVSRSRGRTSKCEGCDVCCAERIPLTAVDLWQIYRSRRSAGGSVSELLREWTDIAVEPPLVDITLKRLTDGKCCFLDRESGRCLNYLDRPLVCQTYICSPAAERAVELRSAVVNTGEDELARLWALEGLLNGERSVLSPLAWDESAFTGKTAYTEILLMDICPPKLWRKLHPLCYNFDYI